MESDLGLTAVACCLESSLSYRLHRIGNPKSMECVEFARRCQFFVLSVLGASWDLSAVVGIDWGLLTGFSFS